MDYSLPPYSVTHVIYERHVKHGYAMCDVHICEAHVCVLVDGLGNLGPGSCQYSLTDPPDQYSAPGWSVPRPVGPPTSITQHLLHTLRVSPMPCLTKTAPAQFPVWLG